MTVAHVRVGDWTGKHSFPMPAAFMSEIRNFPVSLPTGIHGGSVTQRGQHPRHINRFPRRRAADGLRPIHLIQFQMLKAHRVLDRRSCADAEVHCGLNLAQHFDDAGPKAAGFEKFSCRIVSVALFLGEFA